MVLRSELDSLPAKDIKDAVNIVVGLMSQALVAGLRIEICGFGSFSLHHRKSCVGRNPKIGEKVLIR